ncbi:DUF423 domain-containing protein [Chromatium okenii]|uniref:DUF423 domain-containing protein n=1 Tax=Chromatium okenii TaxID=61644 RepID=A0A2S7XMK5_9GAMM|nr:DUF423 domain-containing protein [Chromatium okenii]PQJ94886.1 DUF423 domain-containing protein [Chromatium okenii]
MNQAQLWLTIGAINGGVTVALGAFGAHGLKNRVPPELLANWLTATNYLGIHALVILICGLVLLQLPAARLVNAAGWAFLLGSVLFSGSLYVMTLTGIRQLGMITPIGGVALIIGWTLLALGVWRSAAAINGGI